MLNSVIEINTFNFLSVVQNAYTLCIMFFISNRIQEWIHDPHAVRVELAFRILDI